MHLKLEQNKQSRFSIRKLSVGACSVLIGCLVFGGSLVHAEGVEEGTVATTTPAVDTGNIEATDSLVNLPHDTSDEANISSPDQEIDQNAYKLTYTRPAELTYEGWEHDSLPIGNGEMGSKLYGLVGGERIQFNEKTLWSGGPNNQNPNYNGGNLDDKYQKLPAIREALEKGDIATAKQLAEKHLVGPYSPEYGRYLAFGDIDVEIVDADKTLASTTNYRRELDLNTAIASTSYDQAGASHKRESFISFPDDVSVTHFEKTGETPMTLRVRLSMTDKLVNGVSRTAQYKTEKSTFKEGRVTYEDQGILLSGHVRDNGLQFASYVGFNTDGQIQRFDDHIEITNATYATLLMNAKTNFAQDPKTGYRSTINIPETVKNIVNKAKEKTYDKLRQDHITDYQSLFNRVKLTLTKSDSTKPTNELLRTYNGENGQELEELFFQYGRYLMITSSRNRPNALPANLQGVWNGVDNPPWNSDYHLNVNLQMNYWPVYSTNIAETAIPLINYVDDLRYFGRIAAAEYANIVSGEGEENGWLVHTQSTPFGWTTPGWNYYWGWSPAANAWIMQNVYDYYKFTKDETYLRDKIYPMLKETAKFWNSFLHYDKESDRYVSSPSYSPEHGTITIGNTFDQSLVWQLFHDYMEAADTLKLDSDLVAEIRTKFDKLKPLHINKAGRIKEWYEEDTSKFTGEGVQAGHRHVSELVGLFPGTLFSKDKPEYLEAARNTLNARGDGGTGWSKANKINLWARLLDGNRAHRLLSEQLRVSTLNNLWDTHAPFQIDGNFGATSGMTEMLLQSHTGYIAPLPALPDAWGTGEVSGLVARGNFEVGMKWQDKNLTELTLSAKKGGMVQIDYPGIEHGTVKINGENVDFRTVKEGRIELTTKEGDVVTIGDVLGKVTNVRAERNTVSEATVQFDAVEGAYKYIISRTDLSDSNPATRVRRFSTTETSFVDKGVLASNRYSYTVVAQLDGYTTPISDSVTIKDASVMLDDRDASITYGSSFGNWPDNDLYAGTEKYADIEGRMVSAADATATISFVGTGIEIYGVKSSRLGQALISIDGQDKGEIDFYSSTTAKGVLIGRFDGLSEGNHTLTLRVKPTHKGRLTERAKVSLDYFKVLSDAVATSEVFDDRDSRIHYGKGFGNWSDSALHAGTEKYAEIKTGTSPADVTASLTFDGTGIRVFGLKSSVLGRAIVTIDGQVVEPLDFNKAGATAKKVLIGEYLNLPDGEHTMTIQVDPDTALSHHKISLDYFEVVKAQPAPLLPPTGQDTAADSNVVSFTFPETPWEHIGISIDGISTPLVIAKDGDNYMISHHDTLTASVEDNTLLITLPEGYDRTTHHKVRAVSLLQNKTGSFEEAVILKASEVVETSVSVNPPTVDLPAGEIVETSVSVNPPTVDLPAGEVVETSVSVNPPTVDLPTGDIVETSVSTNSSTTALPEGEVKPTYSRQAKNHSLPATGDKHASSLFILSGLLGFLGLVSSKKREID